jgi:hypothetical protein
MTGFRIEKLRRDHLVDSFTCGRDELDRFLIRYALGNQQANASQTYIVPERKLDFFRIVPAR